MSKPFKLAVLDDDVLNLRLFELNHEMWKTPSIELSLFRESAVALKKVSTSDFDLLITDYEMPGYNGGEVIEKIRSVQAIPIALMTSLSFAELSKLYALPDDVQYFQKPVDFKRIYDLIVTLRDTLSSKASSVQQNSLSKSNIKEQSV